MHIDMDWEQRRAIYNIRQVYWIYKYLLLQYQPLLKSKIKVNNHNTCRMTLPRTKMYVP